MTKSTEVSSWCKMVKYGERKLKKEKPKGYPGFIIIIYCSTIQS